MSRGLSDLQERIILTLWRKRCRFEWEKDESRDEWIGRIPHDEWEASFPDSISSRWTEQQRREYENPDNWICELHNYSSQGRLYRELIPVGCSDSERKKQVTVVGRAIQRLQERGLIADGNMYRRYERLELTQWGSLYGWMLNEGRLSPALRARKHEQRQPVDEHKPNRAYALARLESSIRGPSNHERIIELIRELSTWEKQCILDAIKLMVETDALVPESTDKEESHANG